MNMSTFLNRPDTDDTLQNIRKEYLNTKRNLHELLTNSPTRISQGTRMSAEAIGKGPTTQFGLQQQQPMPMPKPSPHHAISDQDEKLRHQLRDYISNKDRHMAPVAGSGNKPIRGSASNNDGGLQRQLDSQNFILNSLKRELDMQRTINSMLFERLERLEEEVRYIRHTGIRQQTNVASGRSVSSAPSSSHTNGNGGTSYASGDDTKMLLHWDQMPQAGANKTIKHRRSLSNLDDSTARLIQMSGQFRPRQ
ncbi:HHL039Wp [Eremothecium sinecaudum]|uniref:Spindle pole component 29 n=1 Tax=Eremothecium sinecaudum TaxID=45286 RepID=A0A0X8HWD7_9SACH|nr:HHL039Wp [Eremothecium sinecaudum]AMD22731.1 HHL039Wp [Eremothecium sinecaudum]